MESIALRVSKSDGSGGTAGPGPEIAVSLRGAAPRGPETGHYLASLLQGCSLLYPHGRLVVDLAQLASPGADLLGAVERHRSRVEAQGGSLRIDLPATPLPGF